MTSNVIRMPKRFDYSSGAEFNAALAVAVDQNQEVLLDCTGLDYAYHKQFNQTCSELMSSEQVNEIILDFGIVEYLDSSALGMLVMLQKKASNALKKIKIKSARGATEEILRMANIQKMIEFI